MTGRADLIQAQPAGDYDQPAAAVLDLAARGAEQAGERVLDHILGRADVPQHPEGQVDQVGTVLIPAPDDLFVVLLSHVTPPWLDRRPCLEGRRRGAKSDAVT